MTLLWLVVLSSIVLAFVERRRLYGRIELLEHRMNRGAAAASRESATPRPEPRRAAPAVVPATASRDPIAARPATRPVVSPVIPRSRDERPRHTVPTLRLPSVNVPAVLGVVISLLGFSFLLKLAMDHGWLQLPIGTRHLLVAATGIGMIGAGWRLRSGPPAYSRTLIGGGLATLCLTVYSAVLVFRIVGGVFGFSALLVIVGSAGALASVLRSRTLAILGLIGGLSAPLLLPAGSIGLAAVLAYYCVFSAATLGLALRHNWPVFYLLSFCGTFGSSGLWAVYHRLFGPPVGGAAQLWIGLLFALYLGIALASGLGRRGKTMTLVDRLLLLGTPSVTLGLYAIVKTHGDALAVRSLAIGVVYAGCAYLLRRSPRSSTAWVHTCAAVGVAFVALAIPLGLDGEWIALAWATGAALQIFVAMRQRLRGYAIAGLGLLLLTALYQFAYVVDHRPALELTAYLHTTFIAGVWLAVAAMLSAWWIDRRGERAGLEPFWRWIPFAVGIAAWLLTNADEILRLVEGPRRIAAFLGLFAVTALLGDRTHWSMFRRFEVSYAPTLLVMLGCAALALPHPLAHAGFIAWPAALAVLALVLRSQRGAGHDLALWVIYVVGLTVTGWELHYQLSQALDGAWPLATVTTLLAGWLAFAARRRGDLLVYRNKILVTGAGALTLLLVGLQFSNGTAPPLPFVPLLNPVDLATIASIVALATVLRLYGRPAASSTWLAGVSIACLSMTVLRTVHHFAGVPFNAVAMWSSMTAQTAMTVTWAVTGLAAMVAGTSRTHRAMWIAGAMLMGVVVAKLFLVDLAGVNTASRIVSFLGVGALLLAVGYLAPAPPRGVEASQSFSQS